MAGIAFIEALRGLFSPQDTTIVLTALRSDRLVWKALDVETFAGKALAALGDQMRLWTPGNLALLMLGEEQLIGRLNADPLPGLEGGLRQQAVKFYEEFRRKEQPPTSLMDAGLLALALRERRRLTGSWNGLADELKVKNSNSISGLWSTPLACLASFVIKPEELIKALLGTENVSGSIIWASHMVMCMPETVIRAANIIIDGLREIDVQSQLDLLHLVNIRGREDLASKAAGALITSHPALLTLKIKLDLEKVGVEALASRSVAMHQLGMLYQLAGSMSQSRICLKAASTVLSYWQANVQLCAAAGGEEIVGLAQQVVNLPSVSPKLMGALGRVVLGNPALGNDLDEIVDPTRDPYLQIVKAVQMMNRGERETAQELAAQAVDNFLEKMRDGEMMESVVGFIQNLLFLELDHEALLCCEAAMEQRPTDAELTRLTSKIVAGRGAIDRARLLAGLASALQPDSAVYRRHLAEICESSGHWQEAFEQRNTILSLASSPELEDKTAYIRAALHSGRIEAAMQSSYDLLEAHPDLGEAHGWLGKALAMQNRLEEAANHLNRATLIEPEQAIWWLELAGIYRDSGRRNQEIETLRAAVMAAPACSEVQFALGQAFQRDGFTSEALPYLKQAVKLKPGNPTSVLVYSQILRELGHFAEAHSALESSKSKWVSNPELAYEFAAVVKSQEDWAAMLPALELAARADKALPEWKLGYAEALLEDHNESRLGVKSTRAAQAIEIIAQVLAITPDDTNSQFLMAEALRRKGEFARALDLYRLLADKLRDEPGSLTWQVKRGLGLAAMSLDQSELAVVSLKEAHQEEPGNLDILHELTQAYCTAHLIRDAVQTAERSLQQAPHDPNNLIWFAESMNGLGEQQRASEALYHAMELQPENADCHLRLARLQIETGAVEEARVTVDKMIDLPVDAAELQQAAYLYLRLQDSEAAMRCLERVLSLVANPGQEMLFDLAKLYQEAGKLGDAMEAVQRAVSAGCATSKAFLLQADLLAKMGRYEAAQAVLDQLGIDEDGCEELSKVAILERSTLWYLRSGNFPLALQRAEQGLDLVPEHMALRKMAVEAARELLQDEKALMLAKAVPENDLIADESGNGFELFCKLVDLLMDAGDIEEAANVLEVGLPRFKDQPRIQPFLTRLKAIRGEMQGSEFGSYDFEEVDYSIALAKSAFANGVWQTGLTLLEKIIEKAVDNPRAAFELAKAFVYCVEAFRNFGNLNVQSHLPPANCVSEERRVQFEEAMGKAARYGSTPRLQRWHVRGRAAFNPSSQTLKDLAAVATTPEEFASLAIGLRAINNPQAALHAVARFSDSPECLLQQVLCGLSWQPAERMQAAEKLIMDWPNHPIYQAAAAELCLQNGENERAMKLFEAALSKWPDEAAWHAQAAILASTEADSNSELNHWKAAQSLDPSCPSYSRALGKILLQKGDISKAVDALERSTRLEPDNAQGWLGLASALFEAKRLPEAMECALRASELEGDGVDGILLSGEVALAMGEIDMAREYAWVAARRNPYHPNAVLSLSKILSRQGQFVEALSVIEQALPNLKPNIDVLFERARLIFRLKGAAESLGALQTLTRDFGDHCDVLALLAQAQSECGDPKNAERSAFRALRLNPNQPELSMLLGRLQRESGQLDQAVHLFSESIRMDPANVEYYLELGLAYLARREDVQALNIYRQATRVAPKDPRAYCQAATLLRDSKDYPGAEAMLQQAAKLAPDDLAVRRQLVGVMTLNLIHKTQEAGSTL